MLGFQNLNLIIHAKFSSCSSMSEVVLDLVHQGCYIIICVTNYRLHTSLLGLDEHERNHWMDNSKNICT